MATAGQELQKLTECCICFKEFDDPRMLSCIHTFCLQCLKQTGKATKKEPGDKIPCPLCRKVFVIPAEGMNGLQKNFFMQHLIDVTTMIQLGQKPVIDCDMCKALHEGDEEKTKEATMRCLECEDNFCDMCSKTHKLSKLSKSHNIVKIGANTDEDIRRLFPLRKCISHNQKPLDYYCVECEKLVCVSCLLETHAAHKCKDVTTIEEEFRQTIEENRLKISSYADGILVKAEDVAQRKTDFLKELEETEIEIQHRNQELKELIDKLTKSLLDELGAIKHKHIKEFEKEKEDIERFHTILKSFEAYSTELHLKGSASDVCSSINEILKRSDELEKDYEKFLGSSFLVAEFYLEVTPDYENLLLASSNVVGRIQETVSDFENNFVIVGLNTAGLGITNDVVKINLHRPNEVSNLQQLPSTCRMVTEAAAAIHDNTIYLAGVGKNWDEIWKYNSASGWVKCTNLVQGRRGHCAAFLDGVLYICGGFYMSVVNVLWNMVKGDVDGCMGVLDTVEGYDVVANNCTTVGKLVCSVDSSGNCVPFKSSVYIFGGTDRGNHLVRHVQVYNTKQNTCTLLSKPMPRGYHLMRAVLWKTSAILLGCDTCFLFNFETETWQERKQFKTDVVHFGLALVNGRIVVIGGGNYETDKGDKAKCKIRDDVRYVPLQNILDDKPIKWKVNGTIPGGTSISAYVVLREYFE